MRLSIMQGRLSPPVNGHIQEFPTNEWAKEFETANSIDTLKSNKPGIEWMITKKHFRENPFLRNKVLIDISKGYVPIVSVCCDHLESKNFYKKDFLIQNLVPVIDAALEHKIYHITIPLLEKSNCENDNIRHEFMHNMISIAGLYPAMKFSFEADLKLYKLAELVFSHQNFFVTFDTGNFHSYGLWPLFWYFIDKFISKISHVHLKDKDEKGISVKPGTGIVNFDNIFYCLQKEKYSGYYTIQTARAISGQELQTIKQHIEYFQNIYGNA